ncbi:MAG: DUF6471 domain-containing protein [Devosia sp.]
MCPASLLKGELKRRANNDAQLTELLAGLDSHQTERNLNNKIQRGGFVGAFLQCLSAIGASPVSVSL